MSAVQLEKFPYPFKAALTICSDIDETQFQDFLIVQKFIVSKAETALGKGLGLAIGNSFWMFDQPGSPESAFSYFSYETLKETEYAQSMRQLIEAGILDVMHSYGNFTSNHPFTRELAELSLEAFERHALQVNVWTNHGGPENHQNIGHLSQGQGDSFSLPGQNGTYHIDLLKKHGIRFYWDAEISVSNIIGQDRPARFYEAYWHNPLHRHFDRPYRQWVKGGFALWDYTYFKLSGKNFFPWAMPHMTNELIVPETLRDGSTLLKFKRFGHGRYDWSEDLPVVLNNEVLKTLVEKRGYLILYTHMGSKRSGNQSILSPGSVATLKRLAQYQETGQIWIDTTSHLLNYNWAHKNLEWSVEETQSKYVIRIKENGNTQPHMAFTPRLLAGLTFSAPAGKDMIVLLGTSEIQCDVINLRDRQYKRIPLNKTEWPL